MPESRYSFIHLILTFREVIFSQLTNEKTDIPEPGLHRWAQTPGLSLSPQFYFTASGSNIRNIINFFLEISIRNNIRNSILKKWQFRESQRL